MIKLQHLFVIGTALYMAGVLAGSAAYKWVDSSGKTIYSQTPPPVGVPFEIVEQANVHSSSLTKSSNESLEGQVAAARDARLKKKEEQQRIAESDQIKQENCTQAKTNLDALTSRGQVTIKEGDLYRKLTEDERQQRISDAKAQISEFCN